jgi:hypothetical protein
LLLQAATALHLTRWRWLATALSGATDNQVLAFWLMPGGLLFFISFSWEPCKVGIIILTLKRKEFRHTEVMSFAHNHTSNKHQAEIQIFKNPYVLKPKLVFQLPWSYVYKAMPNSSVQYILFWKIQSFNNLLIIDLLLHNRVNNSALWTLSFSSTYH